MFIQINYSRLADEDNASLVRCERMIFSTGSDISVVFTIYSLEPGS